MTRTDLVGSTSTSASVTGLETMHTCLSTAYLGPLSYYCELARGGRVLLEQHEHYVKQSYRNRMVIGTEGGRMALTIPVEHRGGEKIPIREVRISEHGNWRHLHWQALMSAYDKSPFFEFYADDFASFYQQGAGHSTFLFDFNMELQQMVCGLIGITPDVGLTETYLHEGDFRDLRNAISPKTPQIEGCIPYYQVFANRHGFMADLSIVDLLFNMGPEALLVLKRQAQSADPYLPR